jgi:hypothetical protein
MAVPSGCLIVVTVLIVCRVGGEYASAESKADQEVVLLLVTAQHDWLLQAHAASTHTSNVTDPVAGV